jgi:hypothetical protein
MDVQKLVTLSGDARLISASDQIIFPLIKSLQQSRLDQACSRFLAGESHFIGDIAYIQGLKDLETRLKRLQAEGNKAFEELNK